MTIDTRATMRGTPGDSARKRGLYRVILPILIFGILFGLACGILLGSTGVLPWWIGLMLFIISIASLFFFKVRQPSMVYGYFKGARGEEMVAGELARLPATWTIFNGLLLGEGRDADHIAVGPQGIFVIETKHWIGEVSLEQGQVYANGRLITKSPITQLRKLTNALSDVLRQKSAAIHGILCFAGPQFKAKPQRVDEICVCSYIDLAEQITQMPEVLNATDVAMIVAQLGSLSITKGL